MRISPRWLVTLGVVGASLALAAVAFTGARPPAVKAQGYCERPGPDAQALHGFITNGCYKQWAHDKEIRETGPIINGVDNSTHGRVRVYYSPEIYQWMLDDRQGALPTGALIIKEQYPPNDDTLQGWTLMLKHAAGSWDGWYWMQDFFGSPIDASFGYTGCQRCHASADSDMTFVTLKNIIGTPDTYSEDGEIQWYAGHVAGIKDDPATRALLGTALVKPNAAFLSLFSSMPAMSIDQAKPLPNHTYDHVVSGPDGPPQFLTSDQCVGCHNAYDLPNMQYTKASGQVVNLSPYGEWSVSMMGLAGRDPVFHAQLESETTLWPNTSAFIEDTCFRCHGVMGQRQLHIDQGSTPFRHDMVYAITGDKDATFGALARDGISCAVCHHIASEGLGEPETFTGQFNVGPADELNGPYDDPKTKPMKNALGITPQGAKQMSSAALCGSCHTVILPKLPAGFSQATPAGDPAITYEYEQTTYLEWRNSQYQNETGPINPATAQTCQGCHMPQTYQGNQLGFKIANIEEGDYPKVDNRLPDSDINLAVRKPYSRHFLNGINLFVLEMFQQFRPLLGLAAKDDLSQLEATSTSFLLAEEAGLDLARNKTADLEITNVARTATDLEATVRVTNLAGHKFPSGVGFRRAFLNFEVLGPDGAVLWASGRTNELGVIIGQDGRPLATEFSKTDWQPHFAVIDSPSQVQIYEERTLDDHLQLTTSFMGRFYNVKDNRLLPKGWKNGAPNTEFMQPEQVFGDPRYADGSGSDEITYRVPLAAVPAGSTIRVRLFYQTIPPYYLQDRFTVANGPESQRLHALASHLDLSNSPMENWRLEIAAATSTTTN